jgi:hypothetical protein
MMRLIDELGEEATKAYLRITERIVNISESLNK